MITLLHAGEKITFFRWYYRSNKLYLLSNKPSTLHNDYLYYLLNKQAGGAISPEEALILEKWYNSLQQLLPVSAEENSAHKQQAWEALQHQLGEASGQVNQRWSVPSGNAGLWPLPCLPFLSGSWPWCSCSTGRKPKAHHLVRCGNRPSEKRT